MIALNFKQRAGAMSRRARPKLELFLSMCQDVTAFMAGHDGGPFKAFFSPAGGGSLGLYLMTAAEAYDFELGAKLAEFAAPYIERGLLDSVTLLPASTSEELAAFFDQETALRVEVDHA